MKHSWGRRHLPGVVVAAALTIGLAAPAAGDFKEPTAYPTGGDVYGLAIGDLNRDGKTDILASNDANSGDHISYLRGRKNGQFRAEVKIKDPRGPEGIAIARLNSDKRKDFAVADYSDGAGSKVSVFFQNRRGRFKLARKLNAGPGAWLLEATDLNRDRKTDLVVGNFDSDGSDPVSVFLGKRGGKFRARRDYPGAPGNVNGLVVANVTGSKHPDVVTMDSAGRVSAYRGLGNGRLGSPEIEDLTSTSVGYGLVGGRFNPEPGLDLAAVDETGDQPIVFPGSEGFFDPAVEVAQPIAASNGIATADFDRNGYPDLAVGRNVSGIDLHYKTADVADFNLFASEPGPGQTLWVEAGRVNRDNLPDIVTGTTAGVEVYLNQPD